jgi:hypothetical protein
MISKSECNMFHGFKLFIFIYFCGLVTKIPKKYFRPFMPEKRKARIHGGFGPSFFVLIMSVAQTGLILRKLSEGVRRYERTMDFSNQKGLQ